MKKIKAFIIVLVLALAGMVYAAASMQATAQTAGKATANSCCCMSADSCCMKVHKSDNSGTRKESCETGKNGMNCCCASMADHSQSGSKQQDASCCKAHHDGDKRADKQSCQMSKGSEAGCCAGCEDCCHGARAVRPKLRSVEIHI